MTLHNGSRQMAHNLDRFSFYSDFEEVAAEAARLNVATQTIRQYRSWYGEQPVTVISKAGTQSMPAFEVEIRWQVLGEKFRTLRQLEMAFPASNNYAYERRGW